MRDPVVVVVQACRPYCRKIRNIKLKRDVDRVFGQWKALRLRCREKLLNVEHQVTVPQTDTGGKVEYTKVSERNFVKELGKLAP